MSGFASAARDEASCQLGQHRSRSEYDGTHTNTDALWPHGASRNSSQSHWISSPGGCSVSVWARPGEQA